jgi:hypothetical protein
MDRQFRVSQGPLREKALQKHSFSEGDSTQAGCRISKGHGREIEFNPARRSRFELLARVMKPGFENRNASGRVGQFFFVGENRVENNAVFRIHAVSDDPKKLGD